MPDGFTGRFTGGEKLDSYLKELAKKVERPGTLQVGFLEGSTEADGTSIPLIAAVQEFGAPAKGIPPRPFFRTMIAAKSPAWGETMAALLKANGYDGHNALAQMGEGIKGQLQQSIVDTVAPPLSPITLMLRQMRADDPGLTVSGKTVAEAARRVAAGQSASGVSTKPLVDSGNMLASVDYRVSDG